MHEDIVPAWQQRIIGPFVRATMFRRRQAREWPVPDHLVHDAFRFTGNNGASLPARWFPAPGGGADAAGTMVLCHPDKRYAQHWFVREGIVDDLLALGLNVLTFDYTQYGQSRGGSTFLYQDTIRAVDEARRRAPDLPLHVYAQSLGAYAAAVASPWLDVDSLTLESPYPDFFSWYEGADGKMGRGGRLAMAFFGRIFPQTDALIRADKRLPDALANRILVVATPDDAVTAEHLSRRVADAGPADRTRYLAIGGVEHLGFWQDPRFQEAFIETIGGAPLVVA